MSGVRVICRVCVVSVCVVFMFRPRVDFMLSTVNGRRSTVVLALLVWSGRTSRASLLSVISMVSAFIGIGFRWVSMRSVCVVVMGFDVLQAVRIKNEKLRIKNLVFIVLYVIFSLRYIADVARRM